MPPGRSTWELVAIDAGGVTAVVTALLALSKVRPLRWLFRRLFTVFADPLVELVERPTRELAEQVMPVLNDLTTALEAHRQYTYYHLGPNSSAPPLVNRIERLEDELGD